MNRPLRKSYSLKLLTSDMRTTEPNAQNHSDLNVSRVAQARMAAIELRLVVKAEAAARRRAEAPRVERKLELVASPDQYVYFIQCASGAIKIGISTDFAARLGQLQSANPERLGVLGTVLGDTILERDLHREFAADRLVGEWFKSSEALLARIRELCQKSA